MNISSYDPRNEIINLTEPLTAEMKGIAVLPKEGVPADPIEKMKRVRQLLQENPGLYGNSIIGTRVLKITKGQSDRTIKELRREFFIPLCSKETKGIFLISPLQEVESLISASERNFAIQKCRQRGGVLSDDTLTITEHQLAKFTSEKQFWELIKEFKVKKLVLLTGNSQKSYKGAILKQLAEKNVPLPDLLKAITLEFATGEQLKESKAKLRLCGDFFDALFNSGMKDAQNDKITLKEVSLDSFLEVLIALELHNLEGIDEKDPEIGFLQFQPPAPPPLPAGILGQEEWAKWGDVGVVPPPPKELLDIFNNDQHIAFYMPPEIDGKWLTINSFREIAKARGYPHYEYIWDKIEKLVGNQPFDFQKGYWCLRPKILPKPTRGKSFDEQLSWMAATHPDYEVGRALDYIVSELLNHVASGEKQECLLGRSPESCTRCKEYVGGYRVIVGRLAPSGLRVNAHCDGYYDDVGLLPLRKFRS